MKYLSIIIFICLLGCNVTPRLQTEEDNTVLVKVECKDEASLVSYVEQVLRMVRINDLEKESNYGSFFIKARYQNLPPDKAYQIKDLLERTTGVFDVEFIKDGVPVKNVK